MTTQRKPHVVFILVDNLTAERMDMIWMYGPAIQQIIAEEKSVAQYSNIEPGQEFDGYYQ